MGMGKRTKEVASAWLDVKFREGILLDDLKI